MGYKEISDRIIECKRVKGGALVAFVTAGDPCYDISAEIIEKMPSAGVDIIELGLPFSDPFAEGVPIQLSSQRAINAGINLEKVFTLVKNFKKKHQTPVLLMGYFSQIFRFGVDKFLNMALDAGVDGFVIVDLTHDYDDEFAVRAKSKGMACVRLIPPNMQENRLQQALQDASGFVYHVSVKGVTGSIEPDIIDVDKWVKLIKKYTNIPVAVGFGIRNAAQVDKILGEADGVVIGSAIVEVIRKALEDGEDAKTIPTKVSDFISGLNWSATKI